MLKTLDIQRRFWPNFIFWKVNRFSSLKINQVKNWVTFLYFSAPSQNAQTYSSHCHFRRKIFFVPYRLDQNSKIFSARVTPAFHLTPSYGIDTMSLCKDIPNNSKIFFIFDPGLLTTQTNNQFRCMATYIGNEIGNELLILNSSIELIITFKIIHFRFHFNNNAGRRSIWSNTMHIESEI